MHKDTEIFMSVFWQGNRFYYVEDIENKFETFYHLNQKFLREKG